MTTIIYGCPTEDAFTPQQATLLANIYHEPEWITDDGLEMENWNDKLIITTAPKVEIHGFDDDELISYDEAMAFIQNEPESNPQQPSRIAPDVLHASKTQTGMTVTDGIDLVALLIENDLCSDDTPEHIKADLRVLSGIIKILQSAYPFTSDDAMTDIKHRLFNASHKTKEISRLAELFAGVIDTGKFHTTRTTEKAEAQS